MVTTEWTRRRWLDWFVKSAAFLITALIGLPIMAFVVLPAFRRPRTQWLKVGRLDEFRPNEPKAITLTFQRRDGWVIRTVRRTVYVVVKPDGSVKVFSNICTHANCAVRWEPQKRAFFCPCHDGYFDLNGKVMSGPPTRPLDELSYRLQGGFLFIRV